MLKTATAIPLISPSDPRLGERNPRFDSSILRISSQPDSNINRNGVTVFVNGILLEQSTLAKNVQAIAREVSSDFYVVVNRAEGAPGLFMGQAVWNAMRGIVNPGLGYQAEPEACLALESFLVQQLDAGKAVRLLAHSQGALIVSNVLGKLFGSTSSPLKSKSSLISVESFGGAAVIWPDGIRVTEVKSEADFVPELSKTWANFSFSQRYQPLNSTRMEPIVLPLERPAIHSHDLRFYLSKAYLAFEKQASAWGLHESRQQARLAAAMLLSEKFGERFFYRLLQHKAKDGDHSFLQAFIRHAERRKASEYPVVNEARTLLERVLAEQN